ncbi:MAG: hypothetical protein ACJ79S_04350 [Gemmatimonadaceae bacterium]
MRPPEAMRPPVAKRHSPSAAMLLLALALVLNVGCSSARAADHGGGSSNLITADEIAGANVANAYEAVAKLRHSFLDDRGRNSILNASAPSLPNVYLDGMPYGPLSSLSTIPAGDVLAIRLYRAWEATTKYGTGNPAGVIEVTTKRH